MSREPLSQLIGQLRRTMEADALDNTPDADLLNAFRRHRDPIAFEAIVRRHGPRVLIACRKVLADSADVQDAFQATFLVLMRDPSAVRKRSSLASWLFGVAHRISLKALARRKRREQIESQVRTRDRDLPDLSWREACAILHEELDRLPDLYRLPLMLCYLDGLSRDEVAAQLGRTLNSVKKSLENGREQLRKRLTRRGVTLSAGLLAAIAEPAAAEANLDFAHIIESAVRPSANVAALAKAVGIGSRIRTVGLCLAASVLAFGVALGVTGDPRHEPPPKKDLPATPVEKKETPAEEGAKGERISFAGRVVDPEGKPVKGAKVFLVRWGELWPGPDADPLVKIVDTSVKATADEVGRYRFEVTTADYPERWWSSKPLLVAAAEGYGLGMLPVRSTGISDGTVGLVADFPIKGRIINLEGKPLAEIRVRIVDAKSPATSDLSLFVKDATTGMLDSKDPDSYFSNSVGGYFEKPVPYFPTAKTDEHGRFELRGVGRERMATIQIDGTGIATERIEVLTQSGLPQLVPKTARPPIKVGPPYYRSPVEYVAGPDQPFSGVVTDKETGKPIADIRVHLPGPELEAITDQQGKYLIRGGRRSRYAVYFKPPPDLPYHGSGAPGGEMGSTRPARVDIALVPAVWVSGRVIDERTLKPVSGATVAYHAAEGNPRATPKPDHDYRVPSDVRTGLDGAFRLRGCAGKGWIEVRHSRPYVLATEREVQGDPDDMEQPGFLKVADGYMALNLFNALSAIDVIPGKPKEHVITLNSGFTASISLIDRDDKQLKGVIAFGIPRADYRWTKPALGATVEAVAINADHPRSFLFLHPERALGARFQPKLGDAGPWIVKLLPTATVTGRFVDSDGKPRANASMDLYFRYPWLHESAPAWYEQEFRSKTDAVGRFKVTHIIGNADSELWLYEPSERSGPTVHSFRAKPGETKDLGTIKTRPPTD